ncbi:MAG TPA: cyclase dehydrase [Xanthobacteraceae bacterium]|jgi:hypothetical protein|nr:cyclase dehydrase [Xanthobacteraceae bacterium]
MSLTHTATVSRQTTNTLAESLGWFSIALGATEMLAPKALARWLGMEGSEPVLRAYGAREIFAGVGILTSQNPSGWMWGRVAGDALDVATLFAGFRNGNGRGANVAVALAAVLGVTAADVFCAQQLSRPNGRAQGRRRSLRDYTRRVGLGPSLEAARGAARDFKVPEDMRTPAALRPYGTR